MYPTAESEAKVADKEPLFGIICDLHSSRAPRNRKLLCNYVAVNLQLF